MMMTDIDLRDSSTSIAKVNKVEKRPICSLTGCIFWGCIGVIFFVLGLSSLIIDPSSILISRKTHIADGSYIDYMLKEWPVNNILKVYIFNITNGDNFLNGDNDTLSLKEVGPYVFREIRRNHNVTYNDNGTVSFIPKSTVEFVPDLSIGNFNDVIVIPNMVVLMVASLSTNFLATIGLESIITTSGQKFIQNMTVRELLITGHESDFKNYFSYSNATILNYKFGMLEKLYDTGDETITMDLDNSLKKQYMIQNWKKQPQFKTDGTKWRDTRLSCDTVNGSYYGDLYPPKTDVGETISIYHKSFCRPLSFDYTGTMMLDSGLEGNTYDLNQRALSCKNPENVCHCNKTGRDMPSGITDVSACFNNISIGLSMPHFYSGDVSLLEEFDGLTPDEEIHSSFSLLQPDIGMSIKTTFKVQYNLMVRKIKYIKKAKQFSEMNVPIFWVDRSSEDLPDSLVNDILITFKYFPIGVITLSWLLAVSGLTIVVFCSFLIYYDYLRRRKSLHDVETYHYLTLLKKESEKNQEYQNST